MKKERGKLSAFLRYLTYAGTRFGYERAMRMQSFISSVRYRAIKIIFHAARLANINGHSNEFLLSGCESSDMKSPQLVQILSKYNEYTIVFLLIYSLFFSKSLFSKEKSQ